MEVKLDLDERYYAQHKFFDGIGLAEYDLASRKLDGEEKSFLWATNITSVLAPVIWFFGYRIHLDWEASGADLSALPAVTTVFILFSAVFSVMAIIHVANARKNRVLAERKIVLLRRAMGVKYGANSLILPFWRIEGADNPFSLPIFPGYLSYSSFPIFLLSSFSALTVILLFDNVPLAGVSGRKFELANPTELALLAGAAWFFISILVFRLSLREQNETSRLWVARIVSACCRIPIVPNVEYALYRCKLEIAEAARINASIEVIKPVALAVEDKSFFHHGGVSWKSIARAIINFIRFRKRSGASTITQQCARSNFLAQLSPAWRRKIVEISLARWLEGILKKDEILWIYLTTVRFDAGVYGFHRALHHFFPRATEIDRATAFVLVERLGNVRSLFLGARVHDLLTRLVLEGVLNREDVLMVGRLYEELLRSGKIRNEGQATPSQIAERALARSLSGA